MCRILIADDHPLFRVALKDTLSFLEEEYTTLEASTLSEAQDLADDDLDLILLDLSMPETSGFSGLVALRSKVPSVPIVIVSANEDIETVRSSAQYGAVGFIPKTTAPEIMAKAIDTILNGGRYWPTEDAIKPMAEEDRTRRSEFEDKLSKLTPSELRVLELMSEGMSNKAIAFELNIKESTVKTHVTALLRKLDVFNRTQAVLTSKEMGFKPR
ncbi:response regulator transcription factor [Terasakiella sp. A23]|uniref:response regulator transcription factor n=1 Tax=Terasakiella sp. FCG-A23 TaxID=3080561 RepID=UPI002955A4C3|nr:response regulator transcription factor [Terasakiella sp. A23]MDV7340237.1 response regulator transcription factor [Terasakiella sp. A23]